MSEEALELLITTDDPGEGTLEEDNFHHQTGNTTAPPLEKDQRLFELVLIYLQRANS